MNQFQKILIIVLFVTVSVCLSSQESLLIGDNVIEAIDMENPQFKTIGQELLRIPEGSIDYYKLKASTDDTDVKFLVMQFKTSTLQITHILQVLIRS